MRRTSALPIAAVLAVVGALVLPVAATGAVEGKTCVVRQACAHKGTTYKVSAVKVARSIGSGYFKETTSGRFVLVTTTMTNTKSKSSTIMAANLTLRTRSGDEYDVTSKALMLKNALVLLEELQPKLPKTVVLVYEVPARAVRGATLEMNDLWSGDKAKIKLGL
jgi:Domain of unknown function (DUF4352)